MKRNLARKFIAAWILTSIFLMAGAIRARAQEEHRGVSGSVGAGFSPLVGQVSNRLKNGWNFNVGAGYRFNSHFDLDGQYSYYGFGVEPGVLAEAGVPSGNSHLWSITADPRLRLHPSGGFDPYIVAGVGYYRRTLQFTQPTVTPVLIFDPFFGVFFSQLVPAHIVLGNITEGGVGGSLGAGFGFPAAHHTRLFVEARYHYASTGRIPMRMIPLTVGLRW